MKKIIIFGAGNLGKRALKKYGEDNILFIVDNDKNLQGKQINGVEIKSPYFLKTLTSEYIVVIASRQKKSMIEQLSVMGISEYEVYSDEVYFDIPEVVYNPYGGQYIGGELKEGSISKIRDINNIVEQMMEGKLPLFNHIEIETINRCNGVCSFVQLFSAISFLPSTVCNLKCRYCLNFNPFAKEFYKREWDKLIKDVDVLLITPVYYCLSIIEQLDAMSVFEKLRCYVGRLLNDYYEKKDFSFSDGENKIPNKIHYCWFGKKKYQRICEGV